MTTFVKNYIGKGKQVNELDIVKVTLKLEEAQKASFEKDGITYIAFEIAKMKEADKFGRTHTCYYQTKETTQDPEPTDKKKSKGKAKKQESETDDLPF